MCICFIQFLARQIKMEKKGRDQKETDSKYADIDNTLKSIDRKIKEGNVLGHNKVSAMAEQFSNKSQDAEPRVQKSVNTILLNISTRGYSQQDVRVFVTFVVFRAVFGARQSIRFMYPSNCKYYLLFFHRIQRNTFLMNV